MRELMWIQLVLGYRFDLNGKDKTKNSGYNILEQSQGTQKKISLRTFK